MKTMWLKADVLDVASDFGLNATRNRREDGMAIREDLVAKTTAEATAVLRLRDATAYNRMQNGIKTPGISICLGHGRCGFPENGGDTRHCPFCLELGPNVRPKDIAGIVHKFVGGN